MTRGCPPPRRTLAVLQLNMQHSGICRDLMISYLRSHPCDVLLLQDTPDSLRSRFGGLPGYSLFLPSSRGGADVPSGHPLVGVLVKSSLRARPLSFSNPRMCGVLLSTPLGLVAFISAYIHYQRGLGIEALSAMISTVKQETPLILIGADSNGHSPWWGPPDYAGNTVGALVEDCVLLHNLAVENTWPSPPSFVSETARQAWIDVTLTSSRLHPLVSSWRVLDGVEFASDHRALLSTLSLSAQRSSAPQTRLDWGRVDWDAFRRDLAGRLQRLPPSSLDIHTPQGLSSSMTFLTSALQATIDSQVPTKTLSWASNPWWTADIASIRSELNRLRRRWTRTGDPEIKKEANACR